MAAEDLPATARTIGRLKTGGLTALSAWLGAVAAEASPATRKALSRFGMNVGISLQMHNDLHELKDFAEGGNRSDDLRNLRVTWPWGWAAKWIPIIDFSGLQGQLRHVDGDQEKLRSIAVQLYERVGKRAQAVIGQRLERELRLLGEHVESTETMRAALSRLRR